MSRSREPSDQERLFGIRELANIGDHLDSSNPWSYKDFPIGEKVAVSCIDPFTGQDSPILKEDPRFNIINLHLRKYNRKSAELAGLKIDKRLQKAVLSSTWILDTEDPRGLEAWVRTQPIVFVRSQEDIGGQPVIYTGSRKDLKNKVFVILSLSKNFVKLEEVETGKVYRVWHDEVEPVTAIRSDFPRGILYGY